MYPKFLYHKTAAPEGQLIRTEADEPTGEGWVDTPQAFDPAYVPPPVLVPPGTVPADAPGFVPTPYPSFRYHRDGQTQLVRTVEEDESLDPDVWKHSPADFDTVEVPAPAPVVPLKGNSAAMKAELYGAKVTDIVPRVAAMTDVDMLQMVQGFEEANPKGARASVIKAVEKRLAELPPRI